MGKIIRSRYSMPYTYCQVVKMNLPMFSEYLKSVEMNFQKVSKSVNSDSKSVNSYSNSVNSDSNSDTISVKSDTISVKSDTISEKSDTTSVKSDHTTTFSENWANTENMEEFLVKASHEEFSFQNNVDQVTKDWILIYSEISLKGIGSDVSRWVCVKSKNERYVYQRRPNNRRRIREEKATFYRSIVLDNDGRIMEVI